MLFALDAGKLFANYAGLNRVTRQMTQEPSFTIRSYRSSDREAVRRLCCETGFLGEPIDPVYEDRELFADFLTTYYTDHEPESSFVTTPSGELQRLFAGLAQTAAKSALRVSTECRAWTPRARALSAIQRTLAFIHSLGFGKWLA